MANVADVRQRSVTCVMANGMEIRTALKTRRQMRFLKLLSRLDGKDVTVVGLWWN